MLRNRRLVYALMSALVIIPLALLTLYRAPLSLDLLKQRYANPQSKFASLDGLDIHYRLTGIGPDIILIHGTGASLHTWEAWAKDLESDYRVLRYDMPGFGLTGPAPDGNYSAEAQCDWLRKLTAAVNLGKATIAGNSYGGWVAFTCAAMNPELYTSLILIDSSGLPNSGRPMPAFRVLKTPIIGEVFESLTPRLFTEMTLKRTYGNPDQVTEEQIDRYYQLNLRPGNRQALRERLQVESSDRDWARLKTIKQPTLLIWGELDNTYPPSVADAFQAALPHSNKVILPGLGHIPMEEDPKISLVPARQFLATLKSIGAEAAP